MAKDSGEERLIMPTERRIQQLRREGQVPRSRDFESGMSFLAVVVYLAMSWRGTVEKLRTMIALPDASSPLSFGDQYARVAGGIAWIAIEFLLPVFLVAILGGLLGAMFDGKGFPLQTKALAPNFEKINPAQGAKNLFSVRSLLELLKGVIFIGLVLGANIILFRAFYNDLFWAPSCGGGCVTKVFLYLIGSSTAFGIVVVLILAFVDLPISRWHFRRDNRMSVSELKREMREEFGDPQVRRERRRQIAQHSQVSAFVGIQRAQMLFSFGDAAVAISYVPGKTDAPIVAARTREIGHEFVRRAAELHMPIIEDPEIVAQMLNTGVGDIIPQSTFNEVARLLFSTGVVKPNR